MLFSVSQLTQLTNAVYVNTSTNGNNVLSANWNWDESKLSFIDEENLQENQNIEDFYGFSCEKGFYTTAINNGKSMEGKSIYLVRFYDSMEDRDSDSPGDLVFNDILPVISEGERVELTFLPESNKIPSAGQYVFSILQRPGHPGGDSYYHNGTGRYERWSELAIYVTQEQLASCGIWDIEMPEPIPIIGEDNTQDNSQTQIDEKSVETSNEESINTEVEIDEKDEVTDDEHTIEEQETENTPQTSDKE